MGLSHGVALRSVVQGQRLGRYVLHVVCVQGLCHVSIPNEHVSLLA